MSRRILPLAAFILLGYSAAQGAVQLQRAVLTKVAPSTDCQTATSNPPASVTSFLTTDKEAYLWFWVTGAAAGDVFASEYYTPSGQFYAPASGAWDALTSPGNYCFLDLPLAIAGAAPATLPGTWTVRGKYNGSTLFTLTFTISTTAQTCTYTISPTSAPIAAAGGSGSASMTAPAGCSWSASSNASWLTTTSSGSGNGTIAYTAQANTAATARSGTITAGGKTLDVTQSAASSGGGSTLTGNLLQNPGAEAGPANGLTAPATIPGWTSDGNVAVVAYTDSNGQVTATDPGPADRGKNYFDGGYSAIGRISQTVDLSASAAAIDAGTQAYTLAGWLGGWNGQDDSAVFKVSFQNAAGAVTGTNSIGPVLSADRNGANALLERKVTANVPSGTRKAVLTLEITRFSGSANDGVADNLYFGLGSAAGGGTSSNLTLTINQVIDTNCPNNKIIVSVSSASGAVTGLSAANFTLKEGGTSRNITVVPVGAGGTTGALSLAILIDISSSIGSSDLANEKAAAKQLVAQVSASDAVAIYTFGSDVNRLQDFTNDKAKLNAAIDSASVSGSTALYKAVQTAAGALAARAGRKSMVLMTDGDDTVGGVTIDQAISAAKSAGVPVFTVGFGSANQTILKKIAADTGGFFSSGATSAELQQILTSLGQIISSQYEISYTSGSPSTDNTVEITVSSGGQTSTASRGVSRCAGAGGGGGTPGCTYLVQPQTVTAPAAGATGTILVITQAGCALNPAVNVSWIHIIGSNQGAVSYSIDANTGAPRSGNITIGNRTVPVSQDAAVTCAYSLTPASNAMSALGGTSSVRMVTTTGCAWTAQSSASWLKITSAVSGSGGANLVYSVDANTSTSARTATITAAGKTFTVTQAGGASATAPTVASGGVVNAASNRAGAVARGSFFTIYGSNLGPQGYQQVQSYPIPDTMGGVVVSVVKGSYNKRAYLHFVSSVQINGILPSDTPLGDVQLTVSYNGNAGPSSTINVVNNSFGNFSAASGPGPGIIQNYNSATDQPLNMATYPAKPKQIAILWGTGLGPIATPDNTPPSGGDLPVPVEIRVGGKLATRLYSGRAPSFAGVDNVYFEVPADAPLGCSVPVQVTVAGTVSNTVRMAISADGKKCSDTANPYANTTATGAKTGTIGLLRANLKGVIESGKPAADATFDIGIGAFNETSAGGDLAFSPFLNLPPVGSCASTNKALDFGAVMGTNGTSLDRTTARQLDAGTALTVTGPSGSQKILHFDSNAGSGPYLSLIGGSFPMEGADSLPPFLESGTFTVTGPGGKDIGAFTTSISIGQPITWSNQSAISTINRSAGLTVTWIGGTADQTMLIAGGSSDQKTKASGGFFCLAPAAAGTFTVPSNVLADLPATGAATGLSDSIGVLALAALPMSNPQTFTAPGLDKGLIFHGTVIAKTVQVQ